MTQREFIRFLNAIEALKRRTRHSWASDGRQESVAEHSWRLAVMALLLREEFPEADPLKTVTMCLLHDLGEAVTGDIPAFSKTEKDEVAEGEAIRGLLSLLPEPFAGEWTALFCEMEALETPEARLCRTLDRMEAILTHNEAPLSTWLPLEYELNLTYGEKDVAWSPWLVRLREEINGDTRRKIREGEGP